MKDATYLQSLERELAALDRQIGAMTVRTPMKTEVDHITCTLCRKIVDGFHAKSSCDTVQMRARADKLRAELEGTNDILPSAMF